MVAEIGLLLRVRREEFPQNVVSRGARRGIQGGIVRPEVVPGRDIQLPRTPPVQSAH